MSVDWPTIGTVIAAAVALLTYMRAMRSDNRAFRDAFDRRLTSVENTVNKLHQDIDGIRDTKVDKKDWVRESLSTRAKIDRVLEGVSEIKGKIDAEFGVASAINRIADRMAEKHS